MNSGLYYPHRNTFRQLLYTLPGSQVYRKDTNYIPYTEETMHYVNYAPATGSVAVYLNGVLSSTVTTLNASGLYVAPIVAPLGNVDIKSVFSDGSTVTQSFVAINLYTLIYAVANMWSGYRLGAITSTSGLHVTEPISGQIFPGRVSDDNAQSNFGDNIGFPKPADWSSEQYIAALGGDSATGKPGIYPALRKGASLGAVKDVVKSVVGVDLSDTDFQLMQTTGWRLPTGEVRYKCMTKVHTVTADEQTAGSCAIALDYPIMFSDKVSVSVGKGFTRATTGSMITGRYKFAGHPHDNFAVLPDGKVLIAGSSSSTPSNLAEIYDPVAGTWSATGTMVNARVGYLLTMVALDNGKILVMGGTYVSNTPAELYDPSTGTWSNTGQMTDRSDGFAPVKLANGKVLVSGGVGLTTLSTAELYDPTAGTWSSTGSMISARRYHSAVLLPNGNVFVAGSIGQAVTSEVYNTATGTWSAGPTASTTLPLAKLMLLSTGQVLVMSGYSSTTHKISYLYDYVSNTLTPTGSMTYERWYNPVVRLTTGEVLALGGFCTPSTSGWHKTVDIYDPVLRTWTISAEILAIRDFHMAVQLSTGSILIFGGQGSMYGPILNTSELYIPQTTTGSWVETSSTVITYTGNIYEGQRITVGYIADTRYATVTVNHTVTAADETRGGASITLSPVAVSSTGMSVTLAGTPIATWSYLSNNTVTVTGLVSGDAGKVLAVTYNGDYMPDTTHYLLTYDGSESGVAAAVLLSNVVKAFTIGLNIITDGMVSTGEPHVRGVEDTDSLDHTWLNPWATLPAYHTVPLPSGVVSSATAQAIIPAVVNDVSSIDVYMDGQRQDADTYTVTVGTTTTTVDFTGTMGTLLQVFYDENSIPRTEYLTTVAAATGNLAIPLPTMASPYGMRVFVNGAYNDQMNNRWVYAVDTNTVTVSASLGIGDKVYVSYYRYNSNYRQAQAGVWDSGAQTISIWNGSAFTTGHTDFDFGSEVDPLSVKVYVNGMVQDPAVVVMSADNTSVGFTSGFKSALGSSDALAVTANLVFSTGSTVTAADATYTYYQGSDFHINYTTGEIIWVYPEITGRAPAHGGGYSVTYTYFPKTILDYLIGLVKPATVCVRLQFTTQTGSHVFNPWTWGGINPEGNVII